jgi:hypothetical protein
MGMHGLEHLQDTGTDQRQIKKGSGHRSPRLLCSSPVPGNLFVGSTEVSLGGGKPDPVGEQFPHESALPKAADCQEHGPAKPALRFIPVGPGGVLRSNATGGRCQPMAPGPRERRRGPLLAPAGRRWCRPGRVTGVAPTLQVAPRTPLPMVLWPAADQPDPCLGPLAYSAVLKPTSLADDRNHLSEPVKPVIAIGILLSRCTRGDSRRHPYT